MGILLDNRLNNISASLINSPTADNYQSYTVNLLQEKANYDWDYATDKYTIQEEKTVGMQDWQDLKVRITHVLSDTNTSDKRDDDWRQIIFKDISHYYAIGIRYQFDNNIWITVQSDYYHKPTASAIVRRCNNILKWYDSNGVLQTEPCFIEYKVNRERIEYNQYARTYEGYYTIGCQLNKNTKSIYNNQRFVISGQAYKVFALHNYLSQTTYGNDAPLLTLEMNFDPSNNALDDLVNNIAWNSNEVVVSATPTNGDYISPTVTTILQGQAQTYSVYHYINGVVDSNTFTITASGASTSYYTLTIINGNSFSVTSLGYDSVSLVITCKNNVDASITSISINLRGLF